MAQDANLEDTADALGCVGTGVVCSSLSGRYVP